MLTYRRLQPNCSAEEYLQLASDCFPENNGTALATAEYYNWKFRPRGIGCDPQEFCAEESSKWVGYYAALPYPYRLGDRTNFAAMVCDVMTHSSMRGRGIFTALGRYATSEMAASNLAICTGYPVRPGVIPGHIKAGWRVAFPLPVYLRLLDPTALLLGTRFSWAAPLGRLTAASYDSIFRILRSNRDHLQFAAWAPSDFLAHHDFQGFFSKWSTQYKNYLLKNPQFLEWRLGAPGTSYVIATMHHRGDLAAVAICRNTSLRGLPSLALLDLMVREEYLPKLSAFHNYLVQLAREHGSAGVALMCTKADASRYGLFTNGFFPLPLEFKLIVKWLAQHPEPQTLDDPRNWHLTWFDSDDL